MTSLFAHRGHHQTSPENSVAAVAAAGEIGADGVEIDVWLTRDNHLIVNHDRTLAGHSLPDTTFEQVASTITVRPPAQLSEVLAASRDMRVNVEIKSTRSAPYNLRVAGEVARFLNDSPASARCLVSSFSLAVCEEVRRLSPERPTGWLTQRQRAGAVLEQVSASGLTSAHLPFSKVDESVAQRARRQGIELHVWTPNLRRDISRMLEFQVGALITDDVPLAQSLRASILG